MKEDGIGKGRDKLLKTCIRFLTLGIYMQMNTFTYFVRNLRIKDREGEILYDIPYMWNLKRNDTNEFTYKRQTDREGTYSFLGVGAKDWWKG